MLLNARGFAASSLLSLGALLGVMACTTAGAVEATRMADFAGETASADTQYLAQWVMDGDDSQGLPFAIVDKKNAKLFLFARSGRLIGASPVLLGLAPGDRSMPGVGDLAPAQIPPAARTTPAGRFSSEPGHNSQGEAIVWFDYEAALAIHRLRPAAALERRPQRLASVTPDDNRISLGCVVVPGAFYDAVVAPLLGKQRGVVYVMPETQPVQALFNNSTGNNNRLKLALLDTQR